MTYVHNDIRGFTRVADFFMLYRDFAQNPKFGLHHVKSMSQGKRP